MQLSIAKPPWTGLGKRLESQFRKALYDYEMIKGEGKVKVAVALSGGKDSLTLLFLLKAISGKGFPELEIHAIHIDGEFTCGAGVSSEYLREICQKLEVDFIVRSSTKKLEDLECYSCSRERRTLLFEAAKEQGIETIAFGHHRDDNAQTLLMNLLNKGEFAGNLPKLKMHHYGIIIIRPLIYMAENDIREFARQHGFARITCRCPVGQNSMRRQVENLLSQIEALYPNARENIAQASLLYGSQKAENKIRKTNEKPSSQ